MFQAENGIRYLVRSLGLGDVYKRQLNDRTAFDAYFEYFTKEANHGIIGVEVKFTEPFSCLLYTSDAADERSSVDLGGRRIITKKKGLWLSTSVAD